MKEKMLGVFSLVVLLTNCAAGMEVKGEAAKDNPYAPFSTPVSYDTSKIFIGDPAEIGLKLERPHRPHLPHNIQLLPGSAHVNAMPSAPQLLHYNSSAVLDFSNNERRQSDLTDNKKK